MASSETRGLLFSHTALMRIWEAMVDIDTSRLRLRPSSDRTWGLKDPRFKATRQIKGLGCILQDDSDGFRYIQCRRIRDEVLGGG
jgi:hypothetical protein